MTFLFIKLDSKRIVRNVDDEKLSAFFRNQGTLFIAVIIFLCWLPIIVVYYPGSVPHDGYYQLNMFFGENVFNNGHPAFSTWLMGLFMKLGRLFKSDNLGVFSYICFQSVFCSGIFALSIKYLEKLNAPVWLQASSFLYFCFFPVWPAYAQAEIKDTLYTGIFVIYTLHVLSVLKKPFYYQRNTLNIIIFCTISLLLCLMRNNGIHIVLPVSIMIVFTLPHSRKIYSVAFLLVLIIFIIFSHFVIPTLGIKKGSIKEALSIPLQQTARYVVQHGDEVTEEEKDIINKIIPYNKIAKRYDPQLSDPIKNMFRLEANRNQLLQYIEVWLKMFVKHPVTYFGATANNIYGYFYPNEKIEKLGIFQFYTKGKPVATGFFSFNYLDSFASARNIIKDYCYFMREIPGIGFFYSPAAYTWLLIIMCTHLIRTRRIKALIGLSPAIISLLICCASPVNALVRYMLPIMAATPVMIAWTINSENTKFKT